MGVRNVHRATPEWRAELAGYYERNGLAKTSTKYGIQSTQVRKHLKTAKEEGSFSGDLPVIPASERAVKASKNGSASPYEIGRKLSAYLGEVAEGTTSRAVAIGALPGFQGFTTDPEVVRAAADFIRETKLPEAKTPLVELKLRQRIRDLEDAAEMLEAEPEEGLEEFFIAHAGEYADAHGLAYETFRDMGVPARVLKSAGISR